MGPSWSSYSGVTPRMAASWADPRPSRLSLPDSLSACGSPTLESPPWRPTVSSSQASKFKQHLDPKNNPIASNFRCQRNSPDLLHCYTSLNGKKPDLCLANLCAECKTRQRQRKTPVPNTGGWQVQSLCYYKNTNFYSMLI